MMRELDTTRIAHLYSTMSLQSYAPHVHILEKGTTVYRAKASKELIESGQFFAINRDRSENQYGGVLGIFHVKKDLRLVELTAEATMDWLNTYHNAQYKVLRKYLDHDNHDPVPFGAAVDSSFADNDGVAGIMVTALQEAIDRENHRQYSYDGWFIPKDKVWPPSSKNAGRDFHSEAMLFNWRDCMTAVQYVENAVPTEEGGVLCCIL